MLTDNTNDGITSSTYTIGTDWKWVFVAKTYTSVGSNPRCFYTWDGGGQAPFQAYGAQIADITDGTFASCLPGFLAGTPESLGYDFDGNLTDDGRWHYTYDAENRLTSMETTAAGVPRQLISFTYDYLNRRISKKVQGGWNGSTYTSTDLWLRFLYNGWNLIAEINHYAGDTVLRNYFWGLDLSGTGQGAGGVGALVMIQDSGNSYLPVYDGTGNVHGLLKASDGTLAACYEYDAFGKVLRESGAYAATNPFQFSTKYTDIETGLVYYGQRYFSPSLGRFINRDPIAESGGLNLYGFCGNNGVNGWDILGMTQSIDGIIPESPPEYTGPGNGVPAGSSADGYNALLRAMYDHSCDNGSWGNALGLATSDSLMFGGSMMDRDTPHMWDPSILGGTPDPPPPPPPPAPGSPTKILSKEQNEDGSITYHTNRGDYTVTESDNTEFDSSGLALIGGAHVRVLTLPSGAPNSATASFGNLTESHIATPNGITFDSVLLGYTAPIGIIDTAWDSGAERTALGKALGNQIGSDRVFYCGSLSDAIDQIRAAKLSIAPTLLMIFGEMNQNGTLNIESDTLAWSTSKKWQQLGELTRHRDVFTSTCQLGQCPDSINRMRGLTGAELWYASPNIVVPQTTAPKSAPRSTTLQLTSGSQEENIFNIFGP